MLEKYIHQIETCGCSLFKIHKIPSDGSAQIQIATHRYSEEGVDHVDYEVKLVWIYGSESYPRYSPSVFVIAEVSGTSRLNSSILEGLAHLEGALKSILEKE